MEHRLQKRQSVRLEVELAKNGHVIGVSRTTNISGGGVGIEPPQVELRAGEVVDVDLSGVVPSGLEQHVRAVVIHREPDLIGLMFVYNSQDLS